MVTFIYVNTYSTHTFPMAFQSKVLSVSYQLGRYTTYGQGNNWTTVVDNISKTAAVFATRNGAGVVETLEGFVFILGY